MHLKVLISHNVWHSLPQKKKKYIKFKNKFWSKKKSILHVKWAVFNYYFKLENHFSDYNYPSKCIKSTLITV